MAIQIAPVVTSPPISGELVRARRWCAGVFDRLWRGAAQLPCYAENGGAPTGMRRTTILAAAKHRARLFVAAAIGINADACKPDLMTDVEQLRAYYRACRDHSPSDVREWWIRMHPPVRLAELQIGDGVRLKFSVWPNIAECRVTGFGALPARLDSDETAPTIRFQKITATGRLSKKVVEIFLAGPEPERLERVLIGKESP